MTRGIVVAGLMMMLVVACRPIDQATSQQNMATRELSAEGQRQVGMPGVTNFTERRLLRQLYELRDQEIATYTYVADWEGNLHHVCDSIGFGMPFSAQFSNPQAPTTLDMGGGGGRQTYVLPQPEPNGIFLPDSTSATWVICSDPDGAFRPVYVESTITVSTFQLASVSSWVHQVGDE